MNTTENTPAHCHDCEQFADCRQARNMLADTEPVQGWIHDGKVYCANCGGDNDNEYHIGYGRHGGLSDSPIHCAECGVPIIHDLTSEGIKYVLDNLNGCCREVWLTVWGIVPHIPVDSIVIPETFVRLCSGWAGGLDCMLREVSANGNFGIGTIRPKRCDSDEKWYLTLWRNLSTDVYYAIAMAGDDQVYPEGHDDLDALLEFDRWVDEQVGRLEESYGLANWDGFDD